MSDEFEDFFKNIEEVNKLEAKLECDLILLFFHDSAPITEDVVDDLEFYIATRSFSPDKKRIGVMLHTLGGSADAAYHIGKRLQELAGDEKELIFIIPRQAKSAGTLLACSSDKIYTTPITELGPIDPQIYVKSTGGWISARTAKDSLKQVLETMKKWESQTQI